MHYFSGESLPSTKVVLEIPAARSQKTICPLDFQHSLTRISCIFAAPGSNFKCHSHGFLGGISGKEPACQCRRLKRHVFDLSDLSECRFVCSSVQFCHLFTKIFCCLITRWVRIENCGLFLVISFLCYHETSFFISNSVPTLKSSFFCYQHN